MSDQRGLKIISTLIAYIIGVCVGWWLRGERERRS